MARYVFLEWRDQVGNVWTTPSISLLIDTDKTLTAYYEEVVAPTYILTVATTIGGNTDPAPGAYQYDEGLTATVRAIPDVGYNFSHWILDGATYTSNPINVLMDKDHSLTAYFSEEAPPPPPTYKLTISSTIGGTTDPPTGIHEYDEGTTVTVTAVPENGYHFNHWELDGAVKSGTPINVLMDKDHTLLAVFSLVPPPPVIPSWLFLIGFALVGAIIVTRH